MGAVRRRQSSPHDGSNDSSPAPELGQLGRAMSRPAIEHGRRPRHRNALPGDHPQLRDVPRTAFPARSTDSSSGATTRTFMTGRSRGSRCSAVRPGGRASPARFRPPNTRRLPEQTPASVNEPRAAINTDHSQRARVAETDRGDGFVRRFLPSALLRRSRQ